MINELMDSGGLQARVYQGIWVSPDTIDREIDIGDMVIIETLEDALVVGVSKVEDGELWHYNGWIIPRNQIVAIKLLEEE